MNLDYTIILKKSIVDPTVLSRLWYIYDSSFRSLNESSPCRQSFHEEDFVKVLSNPQVIKIVTYIKDNPIAIAMVSNEFSNSPWISEDYFRVHFPIEYKDKRIYYFMGIVIEKKYRDLGLTVRMLKALIGGLPKNILIGFDHSFKKNPRIAKFPYLLGRMFVKRKYLDSMDYYVAKFNK